MLHISHIDQHRPKSLLISQLSIFTIPPNMMRSPWLQTEEGLNMGGVERVVLRPLCVSFHHGKGLSDSVSSRIQNRALSSN